MPTFAAHVRQHVFMNVRFCSPRCLPPPAFVAAQKVQQIFGPSRNQPDAAESEADAEMATATATATATASANGNSNSNSSRSNEQALLALPAPAADQSGPQPMSDEAGTLSAMQADYSLANAESADPVSESLDNIGC